MTETALTEKCRDIMQAALRLIAEQGFHGTPMSQVAKEAGVGVGSIYRYFKDKDELIHALHGQVDNRMMAALVSVQHPAASQKENFIRLLTGLAKHFIAHPVEFKFIEQYFNSPYGLEKKRQKFSDESGVDTVDNPFQTLLSGSAVKDMPRPAKNALAFGPLIFSLREHLAGLLVLDDDMIGKIAEGCWDAVSKN